MKKTTPIFLLIALTCLLQWPAILAALGSKPRNAPQTPKAFARPELGVEILSMEPIAAGHYLHFSFAVTDPFKAIKLLDKNTPLYAVHDTTDRKLVVPVTRIGPWRQTVRAAEAGRHYFALFNSPPGVVNPGDMVSIYLGEERIARLPAGYRSPPKSPSNPALSDAAMARLATYQNRHAALVAQYQACAKTCGQKPGCLSACKQRYQAKSDALLTETATNPKKPGSKGL